MYVRFPFESFMSTKVSQKSNERITRLVESGFSYPIIMYGIIVAKIICSAFRKTATQFSTTHAQLLLRLYYALLIYETEKVYELFYGAALNSTFYIS